MAAGEGLSDGGRVTAVTRKQEGRPNDSDGASRSGFLAGTTDGEHTKNSSAKQQAAYPHEPGFRRGPNSATSEAAAKLAGERAQPLKERVLEMLSRGPASPEELVAQFVETDERVLLNTVRARCSDLHALGRIGPSGTFGIGESGKARVIRWRVCTAEELAIAAARRAAEAEHGEGAANG